jgi:hypothetical protein
VLASFAVVTVARETLLHEVVVVSAICAMVWLIYTVIEYKPWGLVLRGIGESRFVIEEVLGARKCPGLIQWVPESSVRAYVGVGVRLTFFLEN